MHAHDYPGFAASEPGVVGSDGVWTPLRSEPVPELLARGRTCVVAVGSNASPQLMHTKLHRAGVNPEVACVPYRPTGLALAHSAHVSAGGYLAITPYAAPGCVVGVVASWFDADQLAALDATEPNYFRRPLPDWVLGGPRGAQVYVSRWGVLAPDGQPLDATTQARVHAELARDPVLADRLPLADAGATVTALSDPVVQVAVRERLRELRWIAPTGLQVDERATEC